MMMNNPPHVDAVQKHKIAQLTQAIQVGVEQLHNNQHVDGQVSREKMKRKIDAISRNDLGNSR